MKAAEEYHTVAPGLFIWQAYEPSVKADLTSTAILAEGELIFIDPIPLDPEPLEELLALGRPSLIVLTNGNHARAAAAFRDRFNLPVAATAAAAPELGLTLDRLLLPGEEIAGVLTVERIAGAVEGEIALWHRAGYLLLGDAVIHLPPYGFALLPEKYASDAAEMRASLRNLLRHPFTILTFAHGLPLVTQARDRFTQLLA